MARKREIARIDKARRNLKNAQARFTRASKTDFRALDAAAEKEKQANRGKPRDQRTYEASRAARGAVARLARAHADTSAWRGKLATALKAPVRDKQRDVARRPGRYSDPKRARTKVQTEQRQVERTIAGIRAARMQGREGLAQRLVQDAINRGENPEDVYKAIAKRTGMSEASVFTLLKYASPDNPNPV